MKIVVTDGNNRAALAITRSLGREGYQVVVGSTKNPSLASSSRYCTKTFIYPDPEKQSADFVSTLYRIVREEKPDVLLPVSDITTLLVTENKSDLGEYCAVPFPDYESVRQAADKSDVMKLAEKLGVPVPKTIYLNGGREAGEAASIWGAIGYPVVIKPSRSRLRCGNTWRSFGVAYAGSEEELRCILRDIDEKEGFPVLLQERIYGDSLGLFLFMDKGEVIAAFGHRRLREKPPSGGVSVLRESIPIQPRLKEYSELLLKSLNWQGIAMVEFKQDKKSSRFMLMEINGRFWGSLQLAIDAGVNFPVMLVRAAAGEQIAPVNDYKIGVKSRWLWGDVDALLSRLLKNTDALNLPPDHPGRLKTLFEFLKFKQENTRYEVLDRDDIKPWLYETRCWFSERK